MKRPGSVGDDLFVVESSGSRITGRNIRRCSSSSTNTIHHPHHLVGMVEEEEDRISKLPDHVLVLILNLMMTNALGKRGEIEQVVRTSLLSRRWRYLCHHSLKSLTFTFSEHDSRYFYVEDDSVHEAAHRAFVDRVSLILSLPVVGDTIDDLNLTFWLSKCQPYWSDHLPGWISFAMQKRVKRLSINLEDLDLSSAQNYFALDDKLISRKHNMDSLVSLRLSKVDVTGQFLEHLLTICGSLEHLSISYSATLVDFTVSGPSLKLKYLQIHCCQKLQRLVIRHVNNLVSFDYDPDLDSTITSLVIQDAPRLVNARLKFFSVEDKSLKVMSYLPRLQTLALNFSDNWTLGRALLFPKLTNLVKVELELNSQIFICTVCASLLGSCPSVSELILKFTNDPVQEEANIDKVGKLEHPHECLKVVELVGFVGCKLDIGVAMYLIENTLSLEKIVIDPTRLRLNVETRSIAEQVEDDICYMKRINPNLSESELRQLKDSVPRAIAHQYENDMRERAATRANAKKHLATRLSGTRTELVLK